MTGPCKKCGSTSGWDGPKYVDLSRVRYSRSGPWLEERDGLKWTCNVCGYGVVKPTLDHESDEWRRYPGF